MNKEPGWILELPRKYKNICLNIADYCDLLNPISPILEVTTDKKILMSGLYGKLGGTNIWVSHIVALQHFRVSNLEITYSKEESKWSPELPLEQYDQVDRLMNLKAFW